MIYGNAEILGVPWELTIKAFRRHLNASAFDTITGYARAFEQFLNDNQQFFPDVLRDKNFGDALELDVALTCRDFSKTAGENEAFDEGARLDHVAQLIAAQDFQNGLDGDFEKYLQGHWPQQILRRLRSDPDSYYSHCIGERTDEDLLKIIAVSISIKARELPGSPTGLVFAGFGEQSVYPEIYVAKDTGFVARQIVMNKSDAFEITQENNSYISGFAQSSMADTFIIGFDAQVYQTINKVQERALPKVMAPFVEALGARFVETDSGVRLEGADGQVVVDEATAKKLLKAALSAVGGDIMAESRQEHGEPLERVISMLPVEEMAELAATMVDLQSLKEKVTRPSETVGGPVDVAIITKNEGLVWKKRKHFFDAALNQRYLRRLQNPV